MTESAEVKTESETKFTDGPWCFREEERNGHNVRVFVIDQAEGCVSDIAEVYGDPDTAALISASPDLYEALSECEEAFDEMIECDFVHPDAPQILKRIHAALLKARGEQP